MKPNKLKEMVWDVFREVLKLDGVLPQHPLTRKNLVQWDWLAHLNQSPMHWFIQFGP